MAEPAGAQASEYGGFWIRFLATVVDAAILVLVGIGITVATVFLGAAGMTIGALVFLLVQLLYWPLMHASARQATFGKAMLGLKVEHAGTGQRISILRALGRDVIGKMISGAVLMLGFLVAAFTGRKQALHDLIATTVVVREGPAHVAGAVVVAVVGIVGPMIAIPLFGMALFAGMAAAFLGDMKDITGEAKKGTLPSISAPAKPAAPGAVAPSAPPPTAASAADVDKLLAPLAGLDKPGSTRAGPAVLELSTFFSSGNPKVWVRVHVPLVVSQASVVVTQVVDAANQSRYDPKNSFEADAFFQSVQLSVPQSGTPRKEGLRSVNLTAGTTEQQVQKIDGVLKLVVPVGVKTLNFGSADAGKAQEAGGLKLTLTSLKGPEAEFSFNGSRANLLQYRGFDAKGAHVDQQSSSWSGANSGTQSLKFAAPVDRVEASIASEIARREYPFTLARSGGAAAIAAAPVAAKPAPAPAPAKAAPPPAPAKLAAVEAAPKPKPAPRKRAAAPKPPEAVAAAAPAPKAAPSQRIITAPRYSDLMTAVLNRDAAGVNELLGFGKWVDKPDRSGNTPLMVAVSLGDAAIAEALLKAGADGGRALSAARERRDPAMLSLLQRYGAR